MLSQHTSNQPTLFETVYRLAKAQDEKALTQMVREGACLSQFQGEDNIIMLLAKEGDSASVSFLINKFGLSLNDAVLGYAIGGHVKQVNKLIEHGASRHYAVHGYAIGCHVKQVNKLIADGADVNDAVLGYAAGGHVKQVNKQIAEGASRNFAVEGYAIGGHVKQVNKLIAKDASRDSAVMGYAIGGHVKQVNKLIAKDASRDSAVMGYAFGGHVAQVNQQIAQGAARHSAVQGYAVARYLEQANLLPLMAFTDDVELRKLLAEKAKKKNGTLDVNALQEKATKLNKIMREYDLGFVQAQSLMTKMTKGVRAWLLHSSQWAKNNKFPLEIYLHIASFVVGLSEHNAEKILTAVNTKLFVDSTKKSFNKLELGLFSPEKFSAEQREAEGRYRMRMPN